MNGRRTAVGLSLLCALLFSAIAVQSASATATKAVNTTAFTCVFEKGLEDFSDSHCDNKVQPGSGEYGHVAIANDTTTEITVDNSTTGGGGDPAVLAGKVFGVSFEITCKKVHGVGELHNVLTEGSKHTVTGTITIEYTDCSVQKPAKCDVKEPIVVKANFEGVEKVGGVENDMGVRFTDDDGNPEKEIFTEITFINNGAEECALKNKTFQIEGSTIATGTPSPTEKHSGATTDFDHVKNTTLKTLRIGGASVGFENTGTVRMKEEGPIALTTTT